MNFFINLEEVLKNIDGIVWGPPLLILLVGTGIYFTFKLNFIQMFKLPLAIKYLFLNDDDKSDKKYITDIYYASDITAEEYEFLADSIIYSPMLPADYVRDLIKKINILSTGNTKSKEANLRETFHYGNKSIFDRKYQRGYEHQQEA